MFNIPPSSMHGPDTAAMSDGDVCSLLKRAEAEWDRRLHKIARSSQNGDQRGARGRARHFLDSGLCKLAAMRKANRKMKRLSRVSDRTLIRLASTLSLWSPCPEPVDVYGKLKTGGRQRPIASFGLYARAAQTMCKEALVALHGHLFEDWQFGITRGRDACATTLSNKISFGEFTHFAEIDIDSFYGSINPETLAEKEIGLPEAVIRNFIFANAYRYRTSKSHRHRHMLSACREGLPQGSIVSPIVAALVVRKLMEGRDVRSIVNYADNFAILGTSTNDVSMQIQSLQAAFSSGLYGTLRLSIKQNAPLTTGWRFVGYDFRFGKENSISCEPCESSWTRMKKKILSAAKQMRNGKEKLAAVKLRLEQSVGQWQAGYKLSTSNWYETDALRLVSYVTLKPKIEAYGYDEICERVDRYEARLRQVLSRREPGFFRTRFPAIGGL